MCIWRIRVAAFGPLRAFVAWSSLALALALALALVLVLALALARVAASAARRALILERSGAERSRAGGQVLHCDIAKQDLTPRTVLTLARVAVGWSRRGLMVGRSGAGRADCPAVLAAGAHRTTHYAPCGLFVRTSAMRMLTKRAARAAPVPALRSSAPHKSPPPGCACRDAVSSVCVAQGAAGAGVTGAGVSTGAGVRSCIAIWQNKT